MNLEMARRWNELVGQSDIVYYLGDFAMGDPAQWPIFCGNLNGTKILISGNHDRKPDRMRKVGFSEVYENTVVEIDGLRVWMNHYPIDNALEHRRPKPPSPYDVALCGHIHEKWRVQDGCVNVGVDVWDFRPISLSQILTARDFKKPNNH